jgi:hypothetical protein
MKSIYKKILICAVVVCGFTSCFNDLNRLPIDPTITQGFNQDAMFAKIYATLGLTGQKGPDGSGDVDDIDEGTSAFYRMAWELNQFPSDEIWWVWGDVGVVNIRDLSWNSLNSLVEGLYYRLYFDITLCNYFLYQTEGKTDEKTALQRTEVRFIRAMNYWYLLDMYGEGVPFAAKVSDELPVPKENLPQPISRKALYNWLETELKEIEPIVKADGTKTAYYRVDQTAVWLLLSRLYLNAEVYTGTADWNNAALYSGKIMTSSYTLAPEYKHLFMGDNDKLSSANQSWKEIILPIAQDGIQTRCWGGSMFLLAASHQNGMNNWGISDQWECFRSKSNLVKKFFPDLNVAAATQGDETTLPTLANDDRCLLVNHIAATGYSATLDGGAENGSASFRKGWGIAKFSNVYVSGGQPHDATWPDMDIPFLRAAEAYLTYAEAVARGGTATNGTALEAINALRNRAHATTWTNTDVTLDNILDEWSREFFAEGRRRTDLIRFNKFAGNVNYNWEGKGGSANGKNVDAKYNIFPIPNKDIVVNENLSPSEGY